MLWCQFPEDLQLWDHDTAERCRQQLPQIARAAMENHLLPAMFHAPLGRYLDGDPAIAELIDDDDRLLLMLSDLRDFIGLQQRGYL